MDELNLLKEQADKLGISYSNNIGLETLKERIKEKLEPVKEEPEKTDASERERIIKEQTKLVRLRITNMNPAKRDIPGGIYSVSNKYIGTVRKYVPFNTSDDGYHVPQCIYDLLKSKKFTTRSVIKDRSILGGERVVTRRVSEFALEVLPNLTKEELAKLAAEQKATGRV